MNPVEIPIKVNDQASGALTAIEKEIKRLIEAGGATRSVYTNITEEIENGMTQYKKYLIKVSREGVEYIPGKTTSIEEIERAIKRVKTALRETEGTSEIRRLTNELSDLLQYKSLIELLQRGIKVGQYEFFNESEISEGIRYLKELKKHTDLLNGDNAALIDQEIKRLEDLRRAYGNLAHTAIPIEKISTYEELGNELRWYEGRLKHATAAERVEIQRQINALKELQQEWDRTLEEVKAPGDITTLENIEKLEEAISYYEQKIKRANASEIEGLQRTIEMLGAKRDAMQQLTELPSMQKEVADLGRLSGKELKLELKLIGLEEVKSKIRSLQKMLQDPNSKLDASQREEVQKLITAWKGYEKQIKKNNVKFADAWGNLKGIGNSITGITDAIKGNGNAWEKLTAVVDGAISLYESISGIISIIDTLTAVTQVQTGASIAQTAATVGTEAAQGMVAGTSEVAAAALLPMIAANKAATASYLELASAAYFAAHAYIPFAGFGIAAGFSAAAVAETKAIGLMAFANGGLVYGPTMGLIGEYSGASNNPEVVAPLDKLKNIIGDSGSEGRGKVEFVIDGRVLRGILNKTDRIRRRTE